MEMDSTVIKDIFAFSAILLVGFVVWYIVEGVMWYRRRRK